MQRTNLKLGELLLYSGKITQEQLTQALKEQDTTKQKLGEIIIEHDWLSSDEIVETLEFQLGFPRVDLTKYEINANVATLIPESIVKKYKLIAIDKRENTLIVAMVDPLNFFAIDDIKLFTKFDVEPVTANRADIYRVIERYYSAESTKKVLEEFTENYQAIDNDDIDEGEDAEVTSELQ